MIRIIDCGSLLREVEGIGIYVLKELKKIHLPKQVELIEAETRSFDTLSYIEDAERVIIIDAVTSGNQPGSIYRMRGEKLKYGKLNFSSLHRFKWEHALAMGEMILGKDLLRKVIIFGMEVESVKTGIGLSSRVRDALPRMVSLIQEELSEEEFHDRGD